MIQITSQFIITKNNIIMKRTRELIKLDGIIRYSNINQTMLHQHKNKQNQKHKNRLDHEITYLKI